MATFIIQKITKRKYGALFESMKSSSKHLKGDVIYIVLYNLKVIGKYDTLSSAKTNATKYARKTLNSRDVDFNYQ